ncbi:hypothetical protein MVEN_02066500 [Mycena venus]|uniref:RRM domain-containing protein n=1 Tax=Mycena venus TaxID=2733690 RepID=A0A8H6XD72_9AGAR|nr:hypothetical protein MVEN_02066500 [Mycena venus]
MASAIRRGARRIPESLKRATQIELSNLPPTTTPADLRRLIVRAQVQGVEDAAIDYHHLNPTGRAYLKLTHPDFLVPGLDALEKVTISGIHPIAQPSQRPPAAAQLDGNGLSSELDSNGRYVAVWGLPKAVAPNVLDDIIRDRFSFPPGEPYIFKMPELNTADNPRVFTLASRFLVRLASVSEAHRLVRELHMTYYWPERHQTKYPLRARVIY